ncbi:MAG TPA: hypothetical protein VMV10_23835 [Pirellulales bacterium]|nr:hypothetical protein [Pirellulales bacterium]HVA45907.1 hypothetical protein [Pirellulales bacterium]
MNAEFDRIVGRLAREPGELGVGATEDGRVVGRLFQFDADDRGLLAEPIAIRLVPGRPKIAEKADFVERLRVNQRFDGTNLAGGGLRAAELGENLGAGRVLPRGSHGLEVAVPDPGNQHPPLIHDEPRLVTPA